MKLTLNKKNDPRGKHVVLVCSREEAYDVHPVVVQTILKGKARPVREVTDDGEVLYRFNLKFLDRLSLAFPMAEYSPGIFRRLRRAEEIRLAGMEVPKIKVPGFKGKLYDFQKIALGMLLAGEIDLLNDDMGLGKSFVALSYIAKAKAFPALLAVPNNAKFTWAEYLDEFFPEIEYVVYDTKEMSPAERSIALEKRAQITIVNIEAMRAKPIHVNDNPNRPIIGYEYANPELFDYEYAVGILDEHHRVKTPGAQVTHGFFQIKAKRWIGMSGTPILNRPEEIWTMLHKLYPDQFPNYSQFVSRIGLENPNRAGVLVAYDPDAMAELREFLLSISLRRRKDQVLKDLPQVIEVPRLIQLTDEQRALYNEIRDDMILRMDNGEIRTIGGALPQITRLKQACASPELYGGSAISSKVNAMREDVRQLVGAGQKAIIFSQWSRMTRILQREFAEFNPAYVTGEIPSMRKRQEAARRFREDPHCHLYIGTIGANREAINLGVASYVLYDDEGWTPADQDQSTGRSAAGGLRGMALPKGTKVHVLIYRAEDTYEQRIEALLKRKKNITDRFIERDGGKQVERITLADIRSIL